jgi:hypothetical protein
MTYSTDFATTLATIAVKAAKYLGGAYNDQAAVDFAWWSVNTVGDASEDETGDFGRHIRAWIEEIRERGVERIYFVHP